MPSVREILAGYELANAWELEEERERLPRLMIGESGDNGRVVQTQRK